MKIDQINKKWESLITKHKGKVSITALYISSVCPSKMFFGYDGKNKSIYLEFTSETLKDLKCPKIKGMQIEVTEEKAISDKFSYIKITNIENKDEVFMAFCNTLYDALTTSKSYYECVESMIQTLKYYKTYFSNPKAPLSEEEEQGLYAELLYLESLIDNGAKNPVQSWEGPSKNKRDFVMEDCSIEIKSTSGQIHPSIRISNENQLDPSYPNEINLFLKVYVLEKVESGDSIVDVGNRIMNKLIDVERQKEFVQKLLADKVDLSLYECLNKYSVQKEHLYKVNNEFPSITPNKIDKGIFKVEYRLDLSDIASFEVGE